MGRSRQPGTDRPPGPSGPRWSAFRRRLFSWDPPGWGPRPDCWYCGHAVPGADAGEVDHRISPHRRPDLAWSAWWEGERFLVPCHSGRHPCSECGLSCNAVASGGVAPLDHLGRHAGPWSAAFIRAAQDRRQRRPGPASRGKAPASPAKPAQAPRSPAKPDPSAGRAWLND